MAFNLFETPKLTKPVQVYDPTKSVQENMNGQGQPSAANINAAYQTPQAQLQLQQPQLQTTKPQPVVDPNSATSGMDAISAMYTSPEQEEKMRKASVANQRILAVADALRHIGNIYHTVKYAPSQQFNKPWEEEQTRYEKGKAVRDTANARYYSYQQQKAAQDAKQKQWEMDFNLKLGDAARKAGYTEAQIQNMKDRLAQQKAAQEANLAYRRENDEANRKQRGEHYKELEKQGRQRIGIASQNAKNMQTYRQWRMNGGGSGGGGSAPLDTPKGKIVPSGKSHDADQMRQLYNYAETKGMVQKGELQRKMAEMGLGKETPDAAKRQIVMNLLRTNQSLADYAVDRLGWTYGGGTPASDWDQYAEEEDDWSQYED